FCGEGTHDLCTIFIKHLAKFRETLGLSNDGPVKPQIVRRNKASCQRPSQVAQLDFGYAIGLLALSAGKQHAHLSAHLADQTNKERLLRLEVRVDRLFA